MSYTEEQIIEMLGTDIADHGSWVKDLELKDDFVGADTFYLSKSATRTGKTSDTNKDYSEVVAGFLLENNFIEKDKFTGIAQISKKESYTTDKDYSKDNSNLNKIFKKYPQLNQQFGIIIGQSISLSNYDDDKAGVIDYLTYKKESNELFIVQVKPQASKETLLSAVLELQTYYQTIDKEKLVNDLYSVGKISSKNLKIKKELILMCNSAAYNEHKDNVCHMAKLIENLQIDILEIE